MNWFKSTNLTIDWVACSLELTVRKYLYTIQTFPVNSIINMTLTSSKQVLAEVKHICSVRFGVLYPHSLLDIDRVLAILGGGDSSKVLGTDPLH